MVLLTVNRAPRTQRTFAREANPSSSTFRLQLPLSSKPARKAPTARLPALNRRLPAPRAPTSRYPLRNRPPMGRPGPTVLGAIREFPESFDDAAAPRNLAFPRLRHRTLARQPLLRAPRAQPYPALLHRPFPASPIRAKPPSPLPSSVGRHVLRRRRPQSCLPHQPILSVASRQSDTPSRKTLVPDRGQPIQPIRRVSATSRSTCRKWVPLSEISNRPGPDPLGGPTAAGSAEGAPPPLNGSHLDTTPRGPLS